MVVKRTNWELRVCGGRLIPLKLSGQLERLPPIDVLKPLKDGQISAAQCGHFGRLRLHIWPKSILWQPWELLYLGKIYDVYHPNGWMASNGFFKIQGQRSTILTQLSENKHSMTIVSINRPQSLQEYNSHRRSIV
jgi:hypothetical protein